MKALLLPSLIFSISCSIVKEKKENHFKAQLHLKIAQGHMKKKNYPHALKSLYKATKLNPENPEIYHHLALVYYARNKFSLSEKSFLKAIKLNPKYTEAYIQMANMYLQLGFYSKSLKYIRIAEKDLTYSYPEKISNLMAEYHFHKKNYKKTNLFFKKSLKIRTLPCYYELIYGRSFMELKQYRQAKGKFKKALKSCQNNSESLYYYGLSLVKLKLFNEAKIIFGKIKEDASLDVDFYQKAQKAMKWIK